MSKPKRMHPAFILFHVIRSLRDTILPFIAAIIAIPKEHFFFVIIGLIALALVFTIFSTLSWWRFTYEVTNDELRIESGIFIRKKRYISKGRIQSIDISANVLHRVFKLAKVQIETAGSGAEGTLTAIKLSEAEDLRTELKGYQTNDVDLEKTEETMKTPTVPFFQISNKRLFLAGSTSGSIGVLAGLFAFAASEMEQFIPDDFYDNTVEWVVGLSFALLIIVIIVILLFLWLLGIAGTMIKFWNFRIERHEKELFITRGLLEKKQTTIPLNRIQAIGIEESIIRQPLGYAKVFAEVAAGSVEEGDEFSSVLFPMLKESEVEEFLKTILPTHAHVDGAWHAIPKRGLSYYLLRTLLPVCLISVPVYIFFPGFMWAVAIVLLLAFTLGYLSFRDTGFQLEKKRMLLQYRRISKTTMIIFHRRIQSIEKKQHALHRKQGLATLCVSILGMNSVGAHYFLKELAEADADKLANWYSHRKRVEDMDYSKNEKEK
ncbi:PH domain-containing protein [Virgibacillus sp. Bac330]|uniref:PH domain-containing protein n=1 Tax=Virgibacillus sp. Bac330 TaxID=2419841 RepID=UPI000EF473C7|nr:PH domain-containing protein [Virgibacillus sp. Bac330]